MMTFPQIHISNQKWFSIQAGIPQRHIFLTLEIIFSLSPLFPAFIIFSQFSWVILHFPPLYEYVLLGFYELSQTQYREINLQLL